MSDEQGKPQPQASAALPPAYTVELGDDFSSNFRLTVIRQTVRGEWSQARQANRIDPDGHLDGEGKPRVIGNRSMGEKMHAMPEIPGQHITLDPRRCLVTISDPLSDERRATLWERITRVWNNAINVSRQEKHKLPHRQEIPLTVHEFKNVAREIARYYAAGHAKVVSGNVLKLAAVDKLPGDYLYDPDGNYRKPMFEKDVDSWLDQRETLGV